MIWPKKYQRDIGLSDISVKTEEEKLSKKPREEEPQGMTKGVVWWWKRK